MQRGSSLVELALAFPLFTLVLLVVLDIGFLFVRKLALESGGIQLARELSLTRLGSAAEMEAWGENWINGRFRNCRVKVRLESVPTLPQKNPLRSKKAADLLDVTISQPYTSQFPLIGKLLSNPNISLEARAREARVWAP